MTTRLTVLAALAFFCAVVPANATDDASDPTTWPADVTGVWNLDSDASDDIAAALAALRDRNPGGRPEGGRGGGRGMGGGRPGGGRGRPGGDALEGAPRRGNPPDTRDLARRLSQMLISHLDGGIEEVDGADRTVVWIPDGKPRTVAGQGGEVVLTARWEGATLCLERVEGERSVTRRVSRLDEVTLSVEVSVRAPAGGVVRGRLVYRGV